MRDNYSEPSADPDDRILVLMRLTPNTPYLKIADNLELLYIRLCNPNSQLSTVNYQISTD